MLELYRALAKHIGVWMFAYCYKGFRDYIYQEYQLVHDWRDGQMCLVDPRAQFVHAYFNSSVWTQEVPPTIPFKIQNMFSDKYKRFHPYEK